MRPLLYTIIETHCEGDQSLNLIPIRDSRAMDTSNNTNYSDIYEFLSSTSLSTEIIYRLSLLSTWSSVLQVAFMILSLLASLLLNASFTIVVIIHKVLHQKEAVINLVLTISDICYSVVRFVFAIVPVISGRWTFGRPFCYAAEAILSTSSCSGGSRSH